MTKLASRVHRVPNYWAVRYDDPSGWENAHICVTQGDRELQVYTNSLDIKEEPKGKFTNDEINEIKEIAKTYRGKRNNT